MNNKEKTRISNTISERLDSLLHSAYSKGQAYYRLDKYGASEDDDQDWDHYEEGDYVMEIQAFLSYLKDLYV
jgi:hypothetical protein